MAASGGLTDRGWAHLRVTQFSLVLSRECLSRGVRAGCASGGRAGEEVLDLVAIGARELQLVPALEGEEVLAVHVRAQAPYQAQVHDRRAVHPLEELRVEQLLELLHRAAQDMSLAVDVDAHVVAGRIDPLDARDRYPHRLAPLADRQHLGPPAAERLAAVLEQLIERELPAAGDLGDDLHETVALRRRAARPQVLA